MIYLNNAATTMKKPDQVVDAVIKAMTSYASASRGLNESSLKANRMISNLRAKLAEFFGFSYPNRVIFTMNATESLNMIIYGLAEEGDHFITTDLDHNSVLRPLNRLLEKNVKVDFLRADKKGNVSYEELESLINENTKAIICTHESNLTGNILDIKKIAEIAKKHNVYFVLDASQTAGSIPIDMEDIGIDILAFTGHKGLMGPQGTGGFLLSPKIDLKPLIEGGTGILSFEESQPKVYPEHLEAGTLNSHGLAGLLAAIEFIDEIGILKIKEHEDRLTKKFYNALSKIPAIEIYGDFSRDHGPVVSLNIKGLPSSELADILSENYDISVRAGGHCAPRMHIALGTKEMGAVRFSFSYYTKDCEIEAAIKALEEISKELSKEL